MLSEKLVKLHFRAIKIRGGRSTPGRNYDFPIFNYEDPKKRTLCAFGDPVPEEKKPNETYVKSSDTSESYKPSP